MSGRSRLRRSSSMRRIGRRPTKHLICFRRQRSEGREAKPAIKMHRMKRMWTMYPFVWRNAQLAIQRRPAFANYKKRRPKAMRRRSANWPKPRLRTGRVRLTRRARTPRVCRTFETSRRRDVLSFKHHEEVACMPPDEADALLDCPLCQ